MNTDNRETLKALVATMKLRFTSGNSIPVQRAHINSDEWGVFLPALEALLQEPSVPVSELEALADRWEAETHPSTNTYNNPWYDERMAKIKDLRSLINRSHK